MKPSRPPCQRCERDLAAVVLRWPDHDERLCRPCAGIRRDEMSIARRPAPITLPLRDVGP